MNSHITLETINKCTVLDQSSPKPSYLLKTHSGRHLKISSQAYHLLKAVATGISFEAIAEHMTRKQQRVVCGEDVQKTYQHIIDQIAQAGGLEQKAQGFWLKTAFLSARVVYPVTCITSHLFHPLVLVLLAIMSAVVGYLIYPAFTQPEFTLVNTSNTLTTYVLFLIGVVMHELGHASASTRYGVKPGEIGFAIYWIYPVFYSNVTNAWSLKRWQRVVVDIGGVYFQLITCVVYLLVYAVYGWQPAREATLLVLYSCLLSLNPVLKFDGYWVVADALGVTNLSQHTKQLLQGFVQRIKGQPVQKQQELGKLEFILILYTCITFFGWIYFSVWVVKIGLKLLSVYPYSVAGLVQDLLNPPHMPATGRLETIIVPTFVVVGLLLTAWYVVRLALHLVRGALNKIHSKAPMPAAPADH